MSVESINKKFFLICRPKNNNLLNNSRETKAKIKLCIFLVVVLGDRCFTNVNCNIRVIYKHYTIAK